MQNCFSRAALVIRNPDTAIASFPSGKVEVVRKLKFILAYYLILHTVATN